MHLNAVALYGLQLNQKYLHLHCSETCSCTLIALKKPAQCYNIIVVVLNVALNKTVLHVTKKNNTSGDAQCLVDGNLSGQCVHVPHKFNDYWSVDLGYEALIVHVVTVISRSNAANGNNNKNNITLSVSCCEGKHDIPCGKTALRLKCNVVARNVSLRVNVVESHRLDVYEVQVFAFGELFFLHTYLLTHLLILTYLFS